MKKILCVMLLALAAQAHATDYTYPYLILTTAAGSQAAVAVDGLEMTFVDGKLVAKNGDGEARFTLAELASMQFSASKDGIVDAVLRPAADALGAATLYDLSGRQALRPAGGALRPGVYVVRKANGETSKITVK